MTIEIIPFGEIIVDRYQLSRDYQLIEQIAGIWRLTEKCKKHYDPLTYIQYLKGKLEKPLRHSQVKKEPVEKKKPTVLYKEPKDERQEVINELLLL